MDQLFHLFKASTGVCTDSRRVQVGELFFALRGPRFDGNAYAQKALEAGAAYAVVDDPKLEGLPGMVWVKDSLQALQDLARHYRRQFQCPLVGITGSNGKTTTRQLIQTVLKQRFRVHATTGNLNNHIGVPLTLLAMPEDTEVAVIEMGANHQGEIDQLSRIAEPTHGLITNIGKAHLEGFGGLEGVKKGKSELYRFLAGSDGVAFVNRDEPFLTGLSSPVEKRVFYRRSGSPDPADPDYEVQLLRESPFLSVAFLGESGKIHTADTHLSGLHNFANLATAIALGKYFKVPAADIARAAEAFEPGDNRSQWLDFRGCRFFLDAYNANPTSMRAALDLIGRQKGRPRVAVMGSMLELGKSSDQEHADILEYALQKGLEQIYLLGEEFSQLEAQLEPPHRYLPSLDALRQELLTHLPEGGVVLVKGSRKHGLEKLLPIEK